jgi:acyl carrier protein
MTTKSKSLTREKIHNVLWKLAAEHAAKEVKDLTPDTRFVQDLGADSLDLAEMTMELEDQLGISVPEEVFSDPNLTLGQVEQAIHERCS